MIEKYHNPIYALINEKGPLGVNAIATATNIPLSTIQKYLTTQQSYFRKNEDRKWDLPDKVISDITDNSLTLSVNMVENTLLLIQSQLEETRQMLGTALTPISTLKRGLNNKFTPVAGKAPDIHPSILKMDTGIKDMYEVIKKFIKVCPEEYQELLLNVDLYRLTFRKGSIYIDDTFNREIGALLTEQTDTLSDDILKTLEEYQKE